MSSHRSRCLLFLLPVLLAAAAAAQAPAAAPPPSRLGRDVVPTFEAVSLSVDPTQAEFSGSVHVDLRVAHPV